MKKKEVRELKLRQGLENNPSEGCRKQARKNSNKIEIRKRSIREYQ